MDRLDFIDAEVHIRDKILVKHGVDWEEVVEACSGRGRRLRRTRQGRYKLYGRTLAGRYLFVIVIPKGRGLWMVATARDMTANERRQYGRK
jgi:uncharacterized DUF497 family protein